jgi:hypothetical protein
MTRVAYDPCYHQKCDTVDNISWEGLKQTAQLAAYAVQKFAFTSGLRQYLNSH